MPRKIVNEDGETAQEVLARIMLEERAEKAEEKARSKAAKAIALAQHEAQEKSAAEKRARFQKFCDHLLGNHRIGVIPTHRMCALHKDYLSDKSVRMYCGKCRMEWKPGDQAIYIVRDGMKLPNPSGKSWKQINEFFYSFPNSQDLTSRAFRIERVEPEEPIEEPEPVEAV